MPSGPSQSSSTQPPSFTVGEIAALLVIGPDPGGAKAASITARIRHWTRERLLVPVGVRNPGTGRHRHYDEWSVVDAALLNALADDGQVIVGVTIYFAARALARKAYVDWSNDGRDGPPHFLELVSARAEQGMARTVHRHKGYPIKHDPSGVSLIVNLSQIFSRLPALFESDEGQEIEGNEPEL
jgi:hypothetical protein